jgi:hypothetical protein
VPYKDVNDQWNYHVEILHNKYEEEEKEEYIDLGVVKIWIDGEEHEYRPVSIKVALYNGNKLYKTVVLNEDNNWRYEWKGLSADGHWHIREVEVPDGYKTYYTFWNNKFYIGEKEAIKISPDIQEQDKTRLEKYITEIFEILQSGNEPAIISVYDDEEARALNKLRDKYRQKK